ncbi:MAG: SAM-dependent chlorinase/fluorinase [Gammaproteobacteria bacterium]
MIVLFTDYGPEGPYIGQVEVTIYQQAPNEKIINLFSNAPRQNTKASAFLLAAYTNDYPDGTIFFCVVDPGVGNWEDKPVVMRINNHWYVGPDNGLFDIVARRAETMECWEITWRPESLSSSFHGRDLYAPVCTMLANKKDVPGEKFTWQDKHNWPDDLFEVIDIDHFGNCITGIRADSIGDDMIIKVANQKITSAKTFSDVPAGQAFWYENSNGLVEIALNRGEAAKELLLAVGSGVEVL